MVRSLLTAVGISRLVGTAKLRLEQKADVALDQVKSLAMRIAIAAALGVAAVVFVVLAIVVGLVLLFVWIEPEYGAVTSLAIIAGSLAVIALLLALAASIAGRGRKKPGKEQHEEMSSWARERELESVRDTQYALAPLGGVSTPSSTFQELFRPGDPRGPHNDIIALLQKGDTRTIVAVLGSLFAVGWLVGRTLPAAERRSRRR